MKQKYTKITFPKSNLEYKGYFLDPDFQILHREDGPAYIGKFGTKAWFINGLKHREDGPAIEWSHGPGDYYFNGIEYTEKQYWKKIAKIKFGAFV